MNQREVGAKKEEQAGEYLKSCGYELETKNYHCRFGEIDIIARDQILASIEKYCSPKKTFLVSSHLVDELERMTDYAIFMKNGGLVMSGKIDELTEHHGKTMTELYKEVYSDCVM